MLAVVWWLGVGETIREARSADDAAGVAVVPVDDVVDCDAGMEDVEEVEGGLGAEGAGWLYCCCARGRAVVIVRVRWFALNPRVPETTFCVGWTIPRACEARNERARCETGMLGKMFL